MYVCMYDALELSPEEKVDASIATIMRYRTGGDGGECLILAPAL